MRKIIFFLHTIDLNDITNRFTLTLMAWRDDKIRKSRKSRRFDREKIDRKNRLRKHLVDVKKTITKPLFIISIQTNI